MTIQPARNKKKVKIKRRADGRGFWTKGKRRNPVVIEDYHSVDRFFLAVYRHCSRHRAGAELARHLGKPRSLVHQWLRCVKRPPQPIADEIRVWYYGRLKWKRKRIKPPPADQAG